MAVRTEYAQGTPCWVDLTAEDFAGAQRFYGELFDWQFEVGAEESGAYTMCRKDGQNVAGIMPRTGEDMPGTWSTYFASDDVDETAQRIRDHGGTVMMEPMDVMGAGRMCFAFDPTGAAFGVWEPGAHIGAERVNEPGAVCWNDLNTRDGKAADKFYSAVFGHQVEQMGDGINFDYTVWMVDGRQVCGRLKMNDDWPDDVSPHWMTYFSVDDCDKSAAKAAELGGRIEQAPFDSPYGRLAVISDPWQAHFTLMKLADTPR
jgi:predicted enzyme related to lactoylglutathione lyase